MINLKLTCEFQVYQKLSLLYRASKDGFEAASFHAKCDDKPNTLVVIKSENGNIFGGYTEQSWSGRMWKNDPNSFIFSLVNKDNKPIKIKVTENKYSIGTYETCGPAFGGNVLNNELSSGDIYISDKSNLNAYSSSNLGNCFIHPNYAVESTEAKSYLAGSFNFKVVEIEVYTKQKQNRKI